MVKRIAIGLAIGVGMTASGPTWAQNSPSDHTYGARYDLMRRIVGIIGPDPDGPGGDPHPAVRNSYDAAGRLIRVETGRLASWQSEEVAPAHWGGFSVDKIADFTYDGMGRRVKETVSVNGVQPTIKAVTEYAYDSVGRLLCTAVRMDPAQWNGQTDACVPQTSGPHGPDRITKNEYDAAGQLIKVRKAVGTPLEQVYAAYTYTANGKQEYVTDANGNQARFIYDGFDRLFQWNFPEKNSPGVTSSSDYEAYHYDDNGNRIYKRTRDGREIRYTYDALNRMTVKDLPAGDDVYYGYDLRGLQTYARFGSETGAGVTNEWDGLGRLKKSTTTMGGVSRTLSREYDANGNRTQLTFPDGQYFTYEYDGLDRMERIRENGGAEVASFAYNNRGERSAMSGGVASSFTYDGIGRLASITHDMAGTSHDVTYCMGAMSGANCTPAYNPASQILRRTISNPAYAWNGHVNVNRNYAVNGLNQYSTAGNAAFAYDFNGNLISDGTRTYGYDVENRLLSAVGSDSSRNVTLSWDPMGRLDQTVGTVTRRFLYDGDALVAEYDGSGALLRRYVHGAGVDEPLLWYEGSGLTQRRHLRADHQGSIVAVSDASGASLVVNSYDSYGIPDANNLGRFAYTGQTIIPELEMYHYKARIYSPTLGRFLQTDPVGYEDQMNLYAYVANDPVNGRDPTGMIGCSADPQNGQGLPPCDGDEIFIDGMGWPDFNWLSLSDVYDGGWSLPQEQSPLPQNLSDQLPDAKPIDFGCIGSALWANKEVLALDGLSVAASFVPGGRGLLTAGASIVGSYTGVAALGLGVAGKDATGAIIGSSGHYVSVAAGLTDGAKGLAQNLPVAGQALAIGGLLYDGYNAVSGCFGGKK